MNRLHYILKEGYGVTPEKEIRLDGYDSDNYSFEANGKKYVIKIFPETINTTLLRVQTEVLSGLDNEKHILPSILFTLGHETIYRSNIDGAISCSTVFSYLEGDMLCDVGHSADLISDFGKTLAELDKQLLNIEGTVKLQNNDIWDLQNVLLCRDLLKFIKDKSIREPIIYFLNQLEIRYLSQELTLRKCWIHGDANDRNVLTSHDKVSGIIDFGDLRYSHLINEVAIALSYLLFWKEDPVETSCLFIRAYHKILPLTEKEIDLLYYLIGGRLCTTICMAIYKSHNNPSNEYFSVSLQGAENLMIKWEKINPNDFKYQLKKVCGMKSA